MDKTYSNFNMIPWLNTNFHLTRLKHCITYKKNKLIMKQTISLFFFVCFHNILCVTVRQTRSPEEDIFRQFLWDHSDHTATLNQDLNDSRLQLQSLVFYQNFRSRDRRSVRSENVWREAKCKVWRIHFIEHRSLGNSTEEGHEKPKCGEMVSGKDAAQEEEGWSASWISQRLAFYEGILKAEGQEWLW